MPFKVVKTS